MSQTVFWSNEAEDGEGYGGMFVRSDLGKTFTKWTDKGLQIVGIVIDDSNEVEFILRDKEEE
jgi:hypothetical protein